MAGAAVDDLTRKSSTHRNNPDNDGFHLSLALPSQLRSLAGQKHGRTIPLTTFSPALVTARHWRRLSCSCILPAVHRNVLNAVLRRLARRPNPRPTGRPCHTWPTANPLGYRQHMLKSPIVSIVDLCTRHPWWVIGLAAVLAAGSGVYAGTHFAIRTDTKMLVSTDLPWRQRDERFLELFPQRQILVVIDAPTPELVEQATAKLAQALATRSDLIHSVRQPQGGNFFARNGLLYLPTDEVARVTDGLTRADVLLAALATDPSLRGTLDALLLGITGVRRGELKLDDMTRPMTMAADTAENVLAGRPASFSWRALAGGKPAEPTDLRRFIEVEPVLNFMVLEPGRAATDAIAQTASDLKLGADYQARVRQTGRIPTDDDEFRTLKENAGLNAAVSLLAILIILWLALGSARIIFAVAVSLLVGLAISAAWGLFLVGALNLISIAFFVLFIGLGVDFAIQFNVRYRSERHDYPELRTALHSTAVKVGGPLALAALATAVGFSSFLPTAYRGLSELGEIAGSGMIIAFVTSITLLPALLAVLNPPGEPHPMGFAQLAPVDRFLELHRIPVVVIIILVVVLALPLLFWLQFDFNPLHLQSPKVESVATFLELRMNLRPEPTRSRSRLPTSPLRMQPRSGYRRFRRFRKRERSVISCPVTRMKSSSSSTMQRLRSMRRSIPGKSIARPPTKRILKGCHRWPTPCRRSPATTRDPAPMRRGDSRSC